jgi:hypothetical protein
VLAKFEPADVPDLIVAFAVEDVVGFRLAAPLAQWNISALYEAHASLVTLYEPETIPSIH